MSFTPEPETLRSLDDLETLRALANPVRHRILNQLMTFGPQTASQCAAVVDATASNCSYHLRELARYGLVERATDEEHDGRERVWRSIPTGLRLDPRPGDPAQLAAERAMAQVEIDLSNALARRALATWADQPAAWQQASTLSTYGLTVTAAELTQLVGAIDGLLRPFISRTRRSVPDGAEIVAVRLDAFRHPDAQ